MKKRRFLAIIMAVLMVVTLLPSMVFASAPSGELGGKLKIKGFAAVGTELSADYGKAQPQGLADDHVTFTWSREISETELEEVGTEKKYKITEADLGYKLVLEVAGREELGLTGKLKAKSLEVVGTEEEAKALVEEKIAAGEEIDHVIPEEETLVEDVLVENPAEELPAEDELAEETMPDEGLSEDETYELPGDTQEDYDISEDSESESSDIDITVSEEWNEEEDASEAELLEEENATDQIIYSAEAITEDGSGIVDFGIVEIGKETENVKNVTIRNTGNDVIHFKEISPEHFMVQDIKEPFHPGTEVKVWIQPREGLEAGEYLDTITYVAEEGAEVSYTAKMTLTVPENQEEIPPELQTEYAVSADKESLVFANLALGYEQAAELQTVTVTNTGKGTVTLMIPQMEYFEISVDEAGEADSVQKVSLDEGSAITMNVYPKNGLAEGTYSETLLFGIEENAETAVQVTAEVAVVKAEEPVEPEQKISVSVDPAEAFAEYLTEGYTEVEQTAVTVTNDGNVDLVLEQPAAEYFDIGALSAAELPVGESVTFTVQASMGLTAGEYSESIEIRRKTDAESEVLATVEAAIIVEEAPVYMLTVTPETLDFGQREVGYEEAPKSQKVTVVNDSNAAVAIEKPVSEYFRIGNLSQEILEPGEECTFNVRPKNGLEESLYSETIIIPNDAGLDITVTAEFNVTVESVEFTGIQKTADIAGVKNGVEKTAKALGLPSTVVITTTSGKMKAHVKWDVDGCSYDPSNKEAQTFKVKGTVTLPEEVSNPNKISRTTSVKVSVKEAYVPKVPDASENMITGISSEGYTTQSKISFEAVGAGMDNTSPRKGDVRFVPLKWKVIKTNSWDSAPYKATFGITKAGNYTLSVAFDRQKFDGDNWINTGEQDTKHVSFSITQAEEVTPTPKAEKKDTDKKSAVETGDTTPIMPFIIILIVAAACIAGVVIYRNKKK